MIAYLSYFILIVEIVHHLRIHLQILSIHATCSFSLVRYSNCRINHADLVFIASKIGWKENLQELKDTLREGMFIVTRIQDLFSSLSRLVSFNNTFRQTIGTFFNTNLLHTNLISDI